MAKKILSLPGNAQIVLLPPQGFCQEGEIPRGTLRFLARILSKVLTVEVYCQYASKNLDLLKLGPHGIVG